MRSLINFIIRFHYFILFAVIEFFSLFLLVQYNDYHRSSFLNSSSNISGKVFSAFHSAAVYMHLKEANVELNRELARYRNNSTGAYKYNMVKITDILDSVYTQQYSYLPAEVINNSTNKQNNYITLNVGRRNGVHKEMAVVSLSGVVGIVKDVSENYSSVISLLNRNLRLSGMLKKSGYYGSVYWSGKDYHYATLEDLPGHITIDVGDTVITSGYSAIFPKGILIGTVESVNSNSRNDFKSVKVKLSVDFRGLKYVQVIDNLLKSEQLELENRSKYD